MTWLKIDDRMPRNPKILGLSDQSFRALITLWCYAAEHETDGHIPMAAWKATAKGKRASELVDAGLISSNGAGMVIHGFTERNPTKAELESRRQQKSEAGRRGAAARWNGGEA